MKAQRLGVMLLLVNLWTMSTSPPVLAEPWRRHTIDDSSRGADGVRLADVDGDGLLDLTTGWEEGGRIRVYRNPGPKSVRSRWPAVTVGQVKSPEDAVFADLDGDGAWDVVSCCEGRNRTLFFHWAPSSAADYLEPAAWTTDAPAATRNAQAWMFALPLDIDGRNGVDLVLGAKGSGAQVGWLQAPANARDMAGWKWHPLYEAGWIMSLEPADLDRDGDTDVLISDRKGKNRGVLWLENPGPVAARSGQPWRQHRVGGEDCEVMFLTYANLRGGAEREIVVATRNGRILVFERSAQSSRGWRETAIPNPFGLPHGKAVRVADVDLDGRPDLVHTTNTGGNREAPGVTWLQASGPSDAPEWKPRDISGRAGVKFDLLQLLDLDQDGDLDVITCEERDNLGVFWYENPTRSAPVTAAGAE